MATKKVDRRIQRTRQLLQDALITLILEKGYNKITVQHIIDEANVGRSTFYAHYLDKDELMARVEMEIFGNVDFLSIDSSVSILTAGLLGEKYIGISVGAEEEYMQDGDYFEDTQSALVLEDLVGKFLFNEVSE